MHIHAWFGSVDLETGALLSGGRPAEDGAFSLESASRAFPVPQPDLRALALNSGLFAGDAEYNACLREAALSLVQGKLSASVTAEQDLLFAVQALDGMAEALNLLEERLYEWSRLHRQNRPIRWRRPVSVNRPPGLANSTANRRRDCSALLSVVVTLCNCSPANEAEYFTTHKYSLP